MKKVMKFRVARNSGSFWPAERLSASQEELYTRFPSLQFQEKKKLLFGVPGSCLSFCVCSRANTHTFMSSRARIYSYSVFTKVAIPIYIYMYIWSLHTHHRHVPTAYLFGKETYLDRKRTFLFQYYWVFGLRPSSGIVKRQKNNVWETGSVSVLRWGGRSNLLRWAR
jgi:hypothetical protein